MFLRNLILIILALYPFASQLVWLKLFYVGGKKLGFLDIYGFLAVIIALLALTESLLKKKRKIYNAVPVLAFLTFTALSGFSAFLRGEKSVISILDVLISTGAPYIFYSFYFTYLEDENFRLKFYKTIWLSSFFSCLLTVILFALGIGNYDISQDVERYAGFYGDSMTFSLVSLISLAFGTLYYQKIKNTYMYSGKYFYLISGTYALTILILAITLTKISLIVAAFFALAWFGFYRKKIIFVVPALIIISIFLFSESDKIQKRFNAEISIIKSYNVPYFSVYDARGFGSGRFRRWIDAYDIYFDDYTMSEKLFGTFNFKTMHNQYIGFLLLCGAVGFILFLIMLIRFIKRTTDFYIFTKNPEYLMALLLLLIMIIIGFGYMSFTYTYFLWVTFILISLINLSPSTIYGMKMPGVKLKSELITHVTQKS